MTNFKYTLGADPEVFVRDKTTKLIVPVCGKIGGTKKEPLQFYPEVVAPHYKAGYKYQEDNVAFEVNIPPCSTRGEFVRTIERVNVMSTTLLKTHGLLPEREKSAHRFASKELASDQAQLIGCDPDMCAYGGIDDNPKTREPFDIKDLGTWRFTGGHVHFGYAAELGIPPHVIVRLIDAVVYLPLIHKDKQKSRRTMYGLAGLYRPKPYGLEYRTMSNFWLTDPTAVATNSFHLLYDLHNNIEALHEFYLSLPIDKVRKCIDNSGENQKELMEEIKRLPKFRNLNISGNFRIGSKEKEFALLYSGLNLAPSDFVGFDDLG